jgi:uncharacterized phosphosugar-binding protein
MQAFLEYYANVRAVLERVVATQAPCIQEAARLVAATVERDGLIYGFGSGHSMLPALEIYFRAGGLACVDVLYEKTFGRAERLPGYARVLLDSYPITSRDVLVIVSNSGRNALPVEMAIEARGRGIATIAITSLEHSRAVAARHASGLRLFEACDVVIDNCGVAGDAALELDGIGEPVRVGPTSTVAAAFIVNGIVASAVEQLLASNIRPPVFSSMNLDEGDAINRPLLARYKERIRGL